MAKSALTRAIKLTGTDVAEGKRRILEAGPITAMFDNGALRYIRYRGTEVLRGIAYLLRDKNWGTYGPAIENLKIAQRKDGFTISYTATAKDKTQGLRYDARIEASASGKLVFSATGTPLTDFLTNRSGFVVLHPLIGVVGEPLEIVHTDGKKKKTKFPKFISPGQPVFEIRSMKHTVVPGVTATVLMEGNKFEMEDHRNWMDASYKTYVCSLLDPWPYTLKKGVPFTQSITLTIEGKPKGRSKAKTGSGISVAVGGAKGSIPAIGVGVPMAEAQHALAKADLIAGMDPNHLVCQIDGRQKGQREAAAAFRELRERTGALSFLEIVLPAKAPAKDELAAIAKQLRAADYAPDAVVITQMHDLKSFQPNTPRPWGPTYEEMAAAARKEFPGIALGGGMLSFFTELNRKPVPKGLFDFVTHTVCPIVHAADDISVMETLEAIPSIIASTRNMIGKTAPYLIGPSSIPCRDNPYGAGVAPNPGNNRVCLSDMDPRQRGLFAAAWNVGLLAAFAKGGLDAVSLGAVTGPQGAIYRKADYAQPWFDGAKAEVYPTYHVLAGLGAAGGYKRLDTASSAPSSIASLAHQSRDGKELWLANLTPEAQKVKVAGLSGAAELHSLSDANFTALATKPDYLERPGERVKKLTSVELGPYGVVRIRTA
jgi:D-apionolactonase